MAECRECKENGMPKYEFKLSDSSTKSLKCHLFSTTHANSEYVKNFEELEKTKKESKQKAEKQQQPTIENLIDTTLTSSGILSLADKRIISMITCNNLSFGLLSDPAFKAQCKYELKDESDYRKRVLPEAYKLVRAKILKDLDGCANLSFTIDCWAEQKKAITQYAVETGDTNFSLTVREWSLLEELISVLKSTEEASNWFAKSPISSQIPAARCMHKQLFNTTEA
ncbi:hypothetical protein niasHT_012697 [Heterodera trifolii]|uniref:Uncharacterized protein n=1 Tax=Heterodera trifolii TaxID=157864 RepID=A0ABD2L537_9BILA